MCFKARATPWKTWMNSDGNGKQEKVAVMTIVLVVSVVVLVLVRAKLQQTVFQQWYKEFRQVLLNLIITTISQSDKQQQHQF